MMTDVTRLIQAASDGDKLAAADLLPLVYAELRRLAAARMAQQSPGQTLQPTDLVHEAYVKLVGAHDAARWVGREHFFAAAAEAMRHILIDHARRRNAAKRGGGAVRVDLRDGPATNDEHPDETLFAVDEAVRKLEKVDASASQLVKLRYFVGLTIPQAAEAMNISPRSADRLWAYARAWLKVAIDAD